jgi:hypothetical protein
MIAGSCAARACSRRARDVGADLHCEHQVERHEFERILIAGQLRGAYRRMLSDAVDAATQLVQLLGDDATIDHRRVLALTRV